MKRKARQNYHHGDLRAALIGEALKSLRTEGAHSLSLRELARRVGVSHMAPYRHFADKQSLLAAIALEGFLKLNALLEAETACFPADPARQLEASASAYVRFALENPEHFRLMLGGFIDDKERFPDVRQAALRSFELTLKLLEACQAAGLARKGPLTRQALLAWASVHGLTMLFLENKLEFLDMEAAKAHELARTAVRELFLTSQKASSQNP